jgi:ubiquitin-protein ligase
MISYSNLTISNAEYRRTINEYNKSEIKRSISNYMEKRVLREYSELSNKYINSYISVIYNEEINMLKISIMNYSNDKMQSYSFVIDKNYPFTPPAIYYNNKCYSSLLKMPSERFKDNLQKITNKQCLCCQSFICKFNWGPAVTMNIIISEIDRNRNYKRKVVITILIDQIKEKYLIDDIDIVSYLM